MRRRPNAGERPAASPPDLTSQLESLLHQVWLCEAEWKLDDRIDLALRRSMSGNGEP